MQVCHKHLEQPRIYRRAKQRRVTLMLMKSATDNVANISVTLLRVKELKG